MRMSAPLFEPDIPPGLLYRAAAIDVTGEAELLNHVEQIPFSNYEMRGVVARRRVAYFGHTYEVTAGAKPMPEFLLPLRARIRAMTINALIRRMASSGSAPDEREQIRVDAIRMRRTHPVRQLPVHLERAVFQ